MYGYGKLGRVTDKRKPSSSSTSTWPPRSPWYAD
jgi:hypothetical protein